MLNVQVDVHGIECLFGRERLRIEAWGAGVRVRATLADDFRGDELSALLPRPAAAAAVEVGSDSASVTAGAVRCEARVVRTHGDPLEDLQLRFIDVRDGRELLSERRAHFAGPGPRAYRPLAHRSWQMEVTFDSDPHERLYGMGQRQHGLLDQKGCVLELLQRNGEVSIPFAVSSRGYGFLWNNPAVGRAEFGRTLTRWVADAGWQIDYWVTAGSTREILGHYADATGHAPPFPDWATGFWQSRLRYSSQQELLEVAREYSRRRLPLACIVIDFFHWTRQGEWAFDPEAWPDPAAMVAELRTLGVETVVSIWPTVNPSARDFATLEREGWLVGAARGLPFFRSFVDRETGPSVGVPMAFYDPTHPGARAHVFELVRNSYLSLGIRGLWLDGCEPEIQPVHPDALRLHLGTGPELLNAYPHFNARTFHDGLARLGERAAVLLCRSAWAGSQRYGCLLWSGDVPSTFESLRAQLRAGMNAGLSGIGWWTTDVGGFYDGDGRDAQFRELLIRWFQWAVFCPVLRLHGYRVRTEHETVANAATTLAGGDNEVWSFGDDVYGILCAQLELRERLRPYVSEQLGRYASTGVAPLRPIWVDFPDDRRAWEIEDQHMFGDALLIAPVVDYGSRSRQVYLPAGARWRDSCDGTLFDGGIELTCAAPLDRIPVFVRDGCEVAPFMDRRSSAGSQR